MASKKRNFWDTMRDVCDAYCFAFKTVFPRYHDLPISEEALEMMAHPQDGKAYRNAMGAIMMEKDLKDAWRTIRLSNGEELTMGTPQGLDYRDKLLAEQGRQPE